MALSRREENDGPATEFAGGNSQARIVDNQFGKRQLGGSGFAKSLQDVSGEIFEEVARKIGGERAHEHAAIAIDSKAARGQAEQVGSRFGEDVQEAHSARTFFII